MPVVTVIPVLPVIQGVSARVVVVSQVIAALLMGTQEAPLGQAEGAVVEVKAVVTPGVVGLGLLTAI
tara:strand:+ start:378 stop:578 length:201 start_codon:yes stop_codon:yes gene_type:complete